MAVNCWVSPAAMDAVVGDTVMATSTAGVTANAAVPEMSPEVASMVVAPVRHSGGETRARHGGHPT